MFKFDELAEKYGWKKINSMTKYPSILTYHELGEKGVLKNTHDFEPLENTESILVTEKIDGTNTRIIFYGDDYLIGSREDMLYAKGDRIINGTLGIVETVMPIAERIGSIQGNEDKFVVVYGEVYGKGINAGKQYTNSDQKGFRVFDIVIQDEIDNILARELSAIASWRDNGGQSFVTIDGHLLASLADGLFSVPSLTSQEYRDMPKTLVETYEWLQQFKTTRAGMEDGHKGNAEGVVIRNENRSFIRKIRFEDYERTKRAGGF